MAKKIMIVDDDVEFLEELEETLLLSGYEVDTFTDGSDAVARVLEVKPALILLDLKMKGMNGFQVADELTRCTDTSHIPIIALTGYFTEEEHRYRMRRCGIADCLLKPVDPLEVIEKIEENTIDR
jgi:DNA-binding response OmpR family regulator